jgi:hypothetical protein
MSDNYSQVFKGRFCDSGALELNFRYRTFLWTDHGSQTGWARYNAPRDAHKASKSH